ncbi:MAG: enoyl-CoA hydratase [Syntrophales bacterium]|nr:enoyl-CoA hydratase [Syntrophales bacterium]MDD5531783.1 enoyl-CoA hydratase [Syntrophales bacterium]HPL63559.1 enoyl-CoA hydratase [Syntrophales bacterium]
MPEHVFYEKADGVGTITLNQPEKRNALSLGLLKEMDALFNEIEADRQTRAVIIRGAGKVFSAGHDISEMVNGDVGAYNEIFRTCSGVMGRIQSLPQPFIAQVHGIATAAGCQLVAACDLAVAEEGALFGTPGVKIGVFCSTPAVALVRAVGRKRALEMLFTGRLITAREAEQYGLINRVVPAERLEAETRAMAEKVAEASGLTLGIGKGAFYSQVNMDDAHAYEFCSRVMVNNLFAEDADEGLKAFLEKRKPVWKGR